MGNTDKVKGSVKEYIQQIFTSKDVKTTEEEVPPQNIQPLEVLKTEEQNLAAKVRNSVCFKDCFKTSFVLLCLIIAVMSIAEIVLTVSTAIFAKLYGSEQSGRLVGMVILALLAAVTISVLVNAVVAVFRNQTKPLHAAKIVLIIVAIMQGVILGLSVRVTVADEQQLVNLLMRSFHLAKDNNQRHAVLWSSIQYEMTCCGMLGPNDYRTTNLPDYFSPDVPISCCPTYLPNRSELVQEREREICKSRQTYYREGCKEPVLEGFKESANLVLGVTIALIIIEITIAILAAILVRKVKNFKSQQAAEPEKDTNP